jgi:eukaryotic-like serine/threonine-protein kinase
MDQETLQGKYDRYTISQRRPLAHGHASVLYEGRNTAGEVVCVKMLSAAPQDDAFEKEIDAQTRLEHPNILRILDYGKEAHFEPGPFIIYPLCTGGTLRDLIAEKPFNRCLIK